MGVYKKKQKLNEESVITIIISCGSGRSSKQRQLKLTTIVDRYFIDFLKTYLRSKMTEKHLSIQKYQTLKAP